ncbi:MAG: hypothetical protein AB7H97_05280 [Pseudobdellovibrionaceae bacterium]
MEKLSWIKELVKVEQQMEETGLVDMSVGFDAEHTVLQDSVDYLNALKNEFVDTSSAFNELKTSPVGRIKIYGIAKTHADFMLFRNGYKLIFSLKAPGKISARFSYMGSNFLPSSAGAESVQAANTIEETLDGKLGPLGEVIWTYKNQPVQVPNVVRYFMTRFIRESAK